MFHEINIVIHVVAGVLGFFVGIFAYASKKGGKQHIYAGRFFMVSMAVVVVTAVIGVTFFRDRPFLTLITIQSFYMTTSGFRALKYKTNGPGLLDFLLVVLLIGAGSAFVWNMQQANIVWHGSIVFYLLSVLFTVGIYDVLRITKVLNWRNAWLPEHFLKMTSAYTALFSAGLGTILPDLGPLTQILPASAGTVLLIGVIWRFRSSFKRSSRTEARSV